MGVLFNRLICVGAFSTCDRAVYVGVLLFSTERLRQCFLITERLRQLFLLTTERVRRCFVYVYDRAVASVYLISSNDC